MRYRVSPFVLLIVIACTPQDGSDVRDPFAKASKSFYSKTPSAALDHIVVAPRPHAADVSCVSINGAPKNWLTLDSLLPILGRLDDRTPATVVKHYADSQLPSSSSTVGVEARRMIVGYVTGHYPPLLNRDVRTPQDTLDMLRAHLLSRIDAAAGKTWPKGSHNSRP